MAEPQALTNDDLFDRIDVLPPYFALTNVARHDDGSITATAPVEQPLGAERGPISGAEAGRHLAICGSIAAAYANPQIGRFHYLASDAEMRRHRGKLPESLDTIELHATASMINEGTAHAMITARTSSGDPVCSLSCYYVVVGYDMMRVFFEAHCMDTPPAASNPYVELLEPQAIDIAGGHIEVRLGPVQPEACVGHFDGLPAMPVAYLMSNVLAAAAKLLQRETGNPDIKFKILEGSVRADGLAFAGEEVVLKGEFQGTRYGMEWVYLEAFADDEKRVGAVHLKLKADAPKSDEAEE